MSGEVEVRVVFEMKMRGKTEDGPSFKLEQEPHVTPRLSASMGMVVRVPARFPRQHSSIADAYERHRDLSRHYARSRCFWIPSLLLALGLSIPLTISTRDGAFDVETSSSGGW